MTDFDSPDHQLRAIRSLMERATIYRSISAPMALIGGLLSVGVAAIPFSQPGVTDSIFLTLWLGVLAITTGTNFYFLYRGATQRGEAFLSSGMRSALLSLAPAFVTAGLLTWLVDHSILRAFVWVLFYGLGLLATHQFAPRSLTILGLAFFATACALLAAAGLDLLTIFSSKVERSETEVASVLMGITFGGYHLVYAVAVWGFGPERAAQLSSPTENV